MDTKNAIKLIRKLKILEKESLNSFRICLMHSQGWKYYFKVLTIQCLHN